MMADKCRTWSDHREGGASLRLSEQLTSYIQEKPSRPISQGPRCPPGWTRTTEMAVNEASQQRRVKCGPHAGAPTGCVLGHRGTTERAR